MDSAPAHRRGKRDLTSGSLMWNLFSLAAPSAAGIVLQSLYNLVDAFWLGKVGTVALNAPGLTAQVSLLAVAAAFGFSVGESKLRQVHPIDPERLGKGI